MLCSRDRQTKYGFGIGLEQKLPIYGVKFDIFRGVTRLVEWGFYALSASKAIFRARTYNCNLFSPVMMMNESRRKPTTGRQSPSLFDKWHGIFYMPSRIDEAGHTKAFDYPVAEHWGESQRTTRSLVGFEPTSAHTYESEIQRSTTRGGNAVEKKSDSII